MSPRPEADGRSNRMSSLLTGKGLSAVGMRFLFAGAGATFAYLLASNALLLAQVNAEVASVLAYLCGMVVSFTGHKYLTFQVRDDTRAQWARFMVMSAFGLVLSFVLMAVTTRLLGWSASLGTLIVAAAIPCLSFVLMRLWVFRHRK